MRYFSSQWFAFLILLIALCAWGGYGWFVWNLSDVRASYTAALSEKEQEDTRGLSASRLRSSVRDTEEQRKALEDLLKTPILDIVSTIEKAGAAAGVSNLSIAEASPASASKKELTALSIVVHTEGTFPALVRALALLETLPLPTSVQQFEMEHINNSWRLTARLRVYNTSTQP